MVELSQIKLYRITHVENIPHIQQFGITHSNSVNANPEYKSIGDNSLITTRNEFKLNNGRTLGEYIPFYFGPRMPMLYVIQHGYNMVSPTPAHEIVYCITSIQNVINLGLEFIFTDGHAVDSFSSQYTKQDLAKIESIIDWKAITDRYWRDESDLDKKRRREAEFLILGDLASEGIISFLVFNNEAKRRLIQFGVSEDLVYLRPENYF